MKMLSGGIFFSDVGSLCNIHQGPPVNLWTVGTVGQKFVSISSVLLLVFHCGEKCLHLIVKVHHESDSNISSVKSQSLSSLFGAILLNALSRQLCTQKNPKPESLNHDSSICTA